MKIISFSWTTRALLAGAKTVTRRHWKPEYAARFQAGDFILAYDKSPRAHGRPVALIRLTQAPYYEPLARMPDSDFQAEGFGYLAMHGWRRVGGMSDPLANLQDHFEQSRRTGGSMWVVRFELTDRLDDVTPPEAKLAAELTVYCEGQVAEGKMAKRASPDGHAMYADLCAGDEAQSTEHDP